VAFVIRTVPDLARMQADAARAGVDAATIDAFFRQFLERSIA
jgi:chorismate mutase